MGDEPGSETLDVDPDDVLTCLRCGFDLRGAGPDATCPECGLPVAATIRHLQQLAELHRRGAGPGWRLMQSAGLAIVMILAALLVLVLLARSL